MIPDKALVLDVDGVVSPVHGPTGWGDDVTVGRVFGPVIVSAGLCMRLDALAQAPGVQPLWLTDWDAEMRSEMQPFPGALWPAVADPEGGRIRARERAANRWDLMPWWKWWALDEWLDHNPVISTIVWCDDDLSRILDQAEAPDPAGPTRADFCANQLRERGIKPFLLAPDTKHGLSPHELTQIEQTLRR